MKVPFTDLRLIHNELKSEILRRIENLIDTSSFILGESVKDFENRFAESAGAKHCVGLSSGTDANHLALWAHGIGPGDEVIIPGNTFVATAWGATLCGAVPVFADCDPVSYNIDPDEVEAKISPRTKAVVAVHLYGQAADIDPLAEICKSRGILLVEDAAQAHSAEYKGRKAGSLCRAASFSFYPGKNLGAFGEAGAVTTSDDELARSFRMLRDHGCEKKYHHDSFGHNYRMESIQGAVLSAKLSKLAEWTESRRSAAARYGKHLSGIEQVTLPSEMNYAKHVYHLYVIKCRERDNLMSYLAERGISTGLHYPVPLHLQKCFAGLGYGEGDFPVTEDLASNCLSLPMFPGITDEQVDYVCDSIRSFYKLNRTQTIK